MKKILIAFMVAIIAVSCLGVFSACTDNQTYDVVCTIFPQYDFCKQIMGEDASVGILLKSNTDVHNYELSLSDKKRIEKSDVFVYIGGESDAWVKDVQKSADLSKVKMVKLMDAVTIREEETVEGMEEEHEAAAEEETEYDEHIWLSLKNAVKMCRYTLAALCEVYPDKTEVYTANCNAYIAKLTALDEKYYEMVNTAKRDTILVADRFPFLYLAKDYNINYYAAFKGCSSSVEVAPATKIFLQNKFKELDLPGVVMLENGNTTLASSIIGDSGKKFFVLNSCQIITDEQYEDNVTYLQLMESNYDVLKEALN